MTTFLAPLECLTSSAEVCDPLVLDMGTFDCLTSPTPAIVNEFICGQAFVGGESFLDESDPTELVLQPAVSY